MPIKWSALKVNEAADMIEEHLEAAREELECARVAANEALKLPDIPQYVSENFSRITGKLDDCLGGSRFSPDGWMKTSIKAIREDIPAGTVEADQASRKYGMTASLL